MTIYHLGIGGNIGDVEKHILQALTIINEKFSCKILALSNPFKTPPWGVENQDWFINACFTIKTTLEAELLLQATQNVEISLKRQRIQKWGPRTIDIDIIAFDNNQTYRSSCLTIPHPYATMRAFVLKPLCQIAPDLILHGDTVKNWCEKNKEPRITKMEPSKSWKALQEKAKQIKLYSSL